MDKKCFIVFKDGNTQDFEYVFKLYYNRIYGFANKFIEDEDDCKEIAQETFIKLWNSRDSINKEKAVQSYLFQTAKNACLNLIRQNKVRTKYASQYIQEREKRINSEILNSIESNTLTFQELDELVKKSISELPDKCKLVFMKKRFEGMKNKEIALQMGITTKAVEANMTRALKNLSLRLVDYLPAILVIFLDI